VQAAGEHEKQPSSTAQLTALLLRVGVEKDRDAFVILFEYFAPRLKKFYLSRGFEITIAEDLAQDTMLRVWHSAAQYDPTRATPSTWVYVIARNLRADTLRHVRHSRRDIEVAGPTVDDWTPETAAALAQRSARLARALQALPEAQRKAIRAAYFDELSHEQAHQVLGIALGTFKSRLRLALARLRAALEDMP
jgi:RNA polymerase sigma-70 factor, ECF subfamily